MEQAKKVFISYSSKDEIAVKRLIDILDELHISYWKAPEMIPAGSNYAREIPRAIQQCTIFLLVLSARSQDSIWVEKEIDSAVCNRKTIIPFQIDEVPLNDMFRFYLNNVQTISYVRLKDRALEELKERLVTIINSNKDDSKANQAKKMEVQKKLINAEKSGAQISVESEEPCSEDNDSVLQSFGITELYNGNQKNGKKKKRLSSLHGNPEPDVCEYCGKPVKMVSVGVYHCEACGKDTYDNYRKVRMYLQNHGAASAVEIARNTGVPRKVIDYFFRQEYLEIPSASPIRLSCSVCGAPIRTGEKCERCKELERTSNRKEPIKNYSASWHSSHK